MIERAINKKKCIDALESYFLTFANIENGLRKQKFILMQDDAAVHTAENCEAWFENVKTEKLL